MIDSFTNECSNVEMWWKQNKKLLRKNIIELMGTNHTDMEVLQIMVYLLDNMEIKETVKCVGKVGLTVTKKN